MHVSWIVFGVRVVYGFITYYVYGMRDVRVCVSPLYLCVAQLSDRLVYVGVRCSGCDSRYAYVPYKAT